MRKFTNPLNNIKIASPCGADWNEMRGDERKRYCALCRLNVYNLSEMTREEAENFLINAEGRVCLRVYRRADGTVLTKDCPVGWRKIKRKISQTATAAFALIAGFLGGSLAFNQTEFDDSDLKQKVPVVSIPPQENKPVAVREGISNLEDIKTQIKKTERNRQAVVGLMENVRSLKDEPVVLWIE